ncbi:MAG: hypothetical protein COA70_01935 [Planctomycetota bacterium]|nr:MAG: hypothetical protein COA70_01935 [Planctomycetota bacterium]
MIFMHPDIIVAECRSCGGAGRFPLPLGGRCDGCNGARRIAHSLNSAPEVQALVEKLNDRFLNAISITRRDVNKKRKIQVRQVNDEWIPYGDERAEGVA